MTPVALAGFLGVALSAVAPAAQAMDKVSCVAAHEAAQEFRQRKLLAQSREQLIACADPRCPRLVSEECQILLAEIDRLAATTDTPESSPAALEQQRESEENREASGSATISTGTAPASPAGATRAPAAPAKCCAVASQPKAGQATLHLPPPFLPAPRDAPARGARSPGPSLSVLLPGALALAAFGTAAYLGWQGLSRADELHRTCSPDCDPAQVSPVRRQLLMADVSLMTGVGLGTLTAWMIWKARRPEDTSAAPLTMNKGRGAASPEEGWSLVPRLGVVQVAYGGHF